MLFIIGVQFFILFFCIHQFYVSVLAHICQYSCLKHSYEFTEIINTIHLKKIIICLLKLKIPFSVMDCRYQS